jgi:hypothetical protein
MSRSYLNETERKSRLLEKLKKTGVALFSMLLLVVVILAVGGYLFLRERQNRVAIVSASAWLDKYAAMVAEYFENTNTVSDAPKVLQDLGFNPNDQRGRIAFQVLDAKDQKFLLSWDFGSNQTLETIYQLSTTGAVRLSARTVTKSQ